jgi:hypothetical protein
VEGINGGFILVLSCHLPEGTEKSDETISQESGSPGRNLKLEPPE